MLDEAIVATILARHFPVAARSDIDDAARDVVLLNLLVDDRVVVWEDAVHDRHQQTIATVFPAMPRRDS